MTGRKQCLPDRFGSKAEVLSSPVRRLGGAKRYPSIAFCRDDGFRGAQPILRTELSLLFEIRVPSLRGAKRRSNPSFLCGLMDCFAEPVIGRAFAPTRWLAMTIDPSASRDDGVTRCSATPPKSR